MVYDWGAPTRCRSAVAVFAPSSAADTAIHVVEFSSSASQGGLPMISANAVITGSYNYGEVARSILIAIAASYAALDLAGRVTAARGRARAAWLTGGACVMGIGIWEMDLKGMLAFHLPVPVEYYWPTVLAALVVAILASAVALHVASRRRMGPADALIGSVIMGGGIVGQHYLHMAAMRLPAITRYSPILVTISILLAILFSLIALLMAFGLREETRWSILRKLGSAAVMGAAISAMHYIGMAAASFISASPPDLSHAVSISPIANFGVFTIAWIVLAAAITTSSVDRRRGEEVRQLNQELEGRVAERTRQLEAVNQALRREIVEREQTEEALRHSEDHLRLVIDTIPQQIWSGPPDGYLDFFNAQLLSYVGLTQEGLQGEGWQRVLHPDDRERVLTSWRESVMNGTPFEEEVRNRGANGKYRWFLVRGVTLRDSAGRILRWYGTSTDVEDRKQAEGELRKQKEVFQKIFENIPVMIAFFGTDGQIELVNPEWERTIGWTLEEIREQNLDIYAELFPDPHYRQMAREYAAASTSEHTDFKVRVRDGRVIDMAADVVHLSDGSRLGIGKDITERKHTEAALQKSQENLVRVTRVIAMGELAAAIAHEVNQPLTAIVTNANFCLRELAGGTPKVEKLREAMGEIVSDGARASAVTSRIRALLQKGAPERTKLDINQIIEEVTLLLRGELTRNRVSLRTDLGLDLPRVSGDRVQLQQVVINLVMNGIEAMRSPVQTRDLLIKSGRNHNRNEVLIQIQDSGEGLDPQQAKHIFEPFFTTKPEGVGMGLSISRSIVESHGGRLWAESDLKGSLFQFTLPEQ
jgi:PAS domain S-box-containing protein